MTHHLQLPLTRAQAAGIKTGDAVYLTGEILTARDAAHKRLTEALEKGEPLPIDLQDATIFYVGPTPAKPGQVIGAAGPTTSYRMDGAAPALIELGMTAMIGKGMRSHEVISAMKEHGAVYFGAVGGAGALLQQCVESAEIVAYEDLGAEAIFRLIVKDMPLTVVIDSQGNNLYHLGREQYLQWRVAESNKEG